MAHCRPMQIVLLLLCAILATASVQLGGVPTAVRTGDITGFLETRLGGASAVHQAAHGASAGATNSGPSKQIRLMRVDRRLLESQGRTPSDVDASPLVKLTACSCAATYHSVPELNEMRRWSLHIPSADSPSAPAASCPLCLEEYDYSALQLSSGADPLLSVLSGFLDAPRGSVQRPVIAAVVLGVVQALVLTVGTAGCVVPGAVAAADALTLPSVIASASSAIAALSGWWLRLRGAGSWTKVLAVLGEAASSWTGTLAAAASTVGDCAAPFGGLGLLQRLLTSRGFWQQYPLWSVVLNLPFVLQLLLAKVGLAAAASAWVQAEGALLRRLVILEGQLLDRRLLGALQASAKSTGRQPVQ